MQQHNSQLTTAIPDSLTLLDETALVKMGIAGSVHTLRGWRRENRGPRYVKVCGRLVKYRMSDVLDFVNSLPHGGGQVAA